MDAAWDMDGSSAYST